LKPATLASSEYDPGCNGDTAYRPVASLRPSVFWFVATFVTVIVTLGIAAPEESVTSPSRLAVND
jgi:hypothetical protein